MLVQLDKDGLNANHRRSVDGEVLLHDRINEAYRGELGEAFQKKTKKRIDWVIASIKGKNILDVGCSQGIVPILLAKRKVSVTGIDIDQKVIDDAIGDLAKEKDVDGHIKFICDDFMKYRPKKKYDTVVFTEVLEHLYEPEQFVSRAFDLTEVGGGIVITCPFGINDHPDHRQNFYLAELYGIVSQYYVVEEVSVLEKWIGIVGKRRPQKIAPELPGAELLADAESSFYKIERNLTDRTYELTDKIRTLNEELKDARELRQYTKELWRRSHRLGQEKMALQKSRSYKIGRAVTYVPRRLYAQPQVKTISKYAYYTVFPRERRVIGGASIQYKDVFKPSKPNKFYIGTAKSDRYSPKIAAIMDDFTYSSFKHETDITQLTFDNWKTELESSSPDLLFVESAWRGVDGVWTNKIAGAPKELQGIIKYCKERDIPTVFWNKEDPVHLAHFMKAASLFDFVFTTDTDSIPIYRDVLGHDRVYLLPFAAQPMFNNPIEKYDRKDKFNFAGSYYLDYKERCRDFDQIMEAALSFKSVDIFDRNYEKNLPLKYQFPVRYKKLIQGTLPYSEIDKAYKGYKYAITMNTIKYSSTMFARRAFELLASNTITVGNYSKGLKYFLGDLTTSADNRDEIISGLKKILGSSELSEDKYKLLGLRRVLAQHTYEERLNRVLGKVFVDFKSPVLNEKVTVFSLVSTQSQLEKAFENYNRQNHKAKKFIVIVAKDGVRVPNRIAGKVTSVKVTEKKKVQKLIDGSSYISIFNPDSFYGKFYLTDLVLATKYSTASAIGKAASFVIGSSGKITLKNKIREYQEQMTLSIDRSIVKSRLVDGSIADLAEAIVNKKTYKESTLSIDGFNYCNSSDLTDDEIAHIEGDMDINQGADIDDIYNEADVVPDNKLEAMKSKVRKKMRLYKTHVVENNPKEA